MTKKIVGNWSFPTSVRFGPGRISELPDACKATGMKKPLLITDEGLKDLPMVRDAIAANEAVGIPTACLPGSRATLRARTLMMVWLFTGQGTMTALSHLAVGRVLMRPRPLP